MIRRLGLAISAVAIVAGCVASSSPMAVSSVSGSGNLSTPVATSPSISPSVDALGVATTCDPDQTGYSIGANGTQIPLVVRLTCANAVAAALDQLGGSGGIQGVEFHYGIYCAPGAWCAFTSPDRGYVLVHELTGRDEAVYVAVGDDGAITATSPQPFPPTPQTP
jgi:hypothetical protein